MATIQQFAAHPAVSDEALNLTSRTGPAPLMGGAGPGPAIALMGRAAPGTITPLMGQAPGLGDLLTAIHPEGEDACSHSKIRTRAGRPAPAGTVHAAGPGPAGRAPSRPRSR